MLLVSATLWCIQINLVCSSSMMMMEADLIDINDILNVNLMPARFLMLDNTSVNTINITNNNNNNSPMMDKPYDGTFNTAFNTMGFHRTMIKKYMCSNYLAEKILHQVAPAHFKHRIGVVAAAENTKNGMNRMNYDIKEAMRSDEGSSLYKNWLSKLVPIALILMFRILLTRGSYYRTSTMDDIYNHYIAPSRGNGTHENAHRKQDTIDGETSVSPADEYEEGDVTGYAIQQPAYVSVDFLLI